MMSKEPLVCSTLRPSGRRGTDNRRDPVVTLYEPQVEVGSVREQAAVHERERSVQRGGRPPRGVRSGTCPSPKLRAAYGGQGDLPSSAGRSSLATALSRWRNCASSDGIGAHGAQAPAPIGLRRLMQFFTRSAGRVVVNELRRAPARK